MVATVATVPRQRGTTVNHKIQPAPINNTDAGNAKRLIARHGNEIRYVFEQGRWYVWDGTRWALDRNGQVMRRAKETVRAMYSQAAETEYETDRIKLAKWALTSESRGHLEAMIHLAKDERKAATNIEQFDRDPWLLNCANGTLDLRLGKLQKHNQADFITKRLEVHYDSEAPCPTWLTFLDRIFGEDAELIAFIQRAIGYTLTGAIAEHALFFLHGTGHNGKSTLMETLMDLLGPYAMKLRTESLIAGAESSGIPNDIAALPGVRMAVTEETEQGQRMAEALVKKLTGGDRIRARFMRQDFFEFEPSHKLWMMGNHKLIVKGTDVGIWRRINLIPLNVTIPESERDLHLRDKLRAEFPGILNWALEGCLVWQVNGLGKCKAVEAATSAYRHDMDAIANMLEESTKPGGWISVGDLYKVYEQWCEDAGERAISKRAFGVALQERGYTQKKTTQGTRCWLNISLPDKEPKSEMPF